MQSLSWVPSPTQPPRSKCSRSSIVLVFNLVLALGISTTEGINNNNNNNNTNLYSAIMPLGGLAATGPIGDKRRFHPL